MTDDIGAYRPFALLLSPRLIERLILLQQLVNALRADLRELGFV